MTLLISSCKGDNSSAGISSLSEDEDVIVRSDTLGGLQSSIVLAQPVYATPDSFLLGECRTNDYGTLHADILTQFACPEGWVYPDSSELDSVCVYIYYRSWYGDGQSPLALTAYELDQEPLHYDSVYPSNVPVSRFCTQTKKMLQKDAVISPAHPMDSIYSKTTNSYIPYVSLKLSDEYAKKLFAIRDFSSQAAFNKQFQGVMLTSTYGSSAALYVSSVCLTIHYHYTYPTGTSFKTMPDTKVFYSNTEVKQLSHYDYADHEQVFETLQANTDVNYVLSPANVYSRIQIPLNEFFEHITANVNMRRPYINLARLRLDVMNGTATGTQEDNWVRPAADMMLLREDKFEAICIKRELPVGDEAVFATLTRTYDTLTSDYQYYYNFDLASTFTQMLRDSLRDTLNMLVIPVDLGYTTSNNTTYVSSIKIKQCASATVIHSTKDLAFPMDIEVVYSGFSNSRIR